MIADSKQNNFPTIPSNANTIIIILGQCSLKSGQPHPWLIERIHTLYNLLISQNFDLTTTYIIASGSDVSNRDYGICEVELKHRSEAWWIRQILLEVIRQNKGLGSISEEVLKDHVLMQDKANTTIENFYYAFKMIHRSPLQGKIKNIYIITSDFHMKRAKLCFNTLFFYENKKQKRQFIGDENTFVYKDQVHFVEGVSKWSNDLDRRKKFYREQKYCRDEWIINQMRKYTRKLWTQCQKLPSNISTSIKKSLQQDPISGQKFTNDLIESQHKRKEQNINDIVQQARKQNLVVDWFNKRVWYKQHYFYSRDEDYGKEYAEVDLEKRDTELIGHFQQSESKYIADVTGTYVYFVMNNNIVESDISKSQINGKLTFQRTQKGIKISEVKLLDAGTPLETYFKDVLNMRKIE